MNLKLHSNGGGAFRAAGLGLAVLLVIAAALAAGIVRAQGPSPGPVIEGAIVSGSDLLVREGSWRTYTVRLATRPSADVTIALHPHNDGSRSVHVQWDGGQSEATFTPSNWNTPQTVHVWGNHDHDYRYVHGQGWQKRVVNDVQHVYHVMTSDDPDYWDQEVLTARVTDDDGLSLSAPSLTVSEGGTATFTVRLITQPTASVNVSFAAAGDESVTVSPGSLTFTSANHSTAQTVTVSAAPDADTADGTATVTMTANGGNYVYHRDALTVTESDTGAAAVTPTPTPEPTPTPGPSARLVVETPPECDRDTLDIHGNPIDGMKVEQGGSCTFTVRLGSRPTANVPVNVREYGDRTGVISHAPGTLTFTPDNWETAQAVTVRSSGNEYSPVHSADLMIRTGGTDDLSGYYNLPWTWLRVNQVKAAALHISGRDLVRTGGAELTVDEGSSNDYQVRLNTRPAANVTVSVAAGSTPQDDPSLTASPASLTFTPDNWDRGQRVTVSAAHDVDLVDGRTGITHTSASADAAYDGLTSAVTAVENEDDAASLVLSTAALTVPEGGAASYTVKLSNQPQASVTVLVAVELAGDTDLTIGGGGSLTFTKHNWNVGQAVTVSAAQDGDDLAGTRNITHLASGDEFAGLSATVTATEGDDDRRGFVVSPAPGPVSMAEGGTHTYTVALGTEPTADVTVAIARSPGGDADVTVAPSSLTFNAGNYSTAQTVTISAAEDDADYGDDAATFFHTVTTTDPIYAEQSIGDVPVTVDDNDAALVLSAEAVTVREGGTASYTVRLTNRPTADVVVTVAGGAGDASITVAVPSSGRLTFTAQDWDAPQTVTLRASADSDAINGTRTITHTGSGAAEFAGAAASMTAVERDARANLALRNSTDTGSVTAVAVPEEGSASYKLKLAAQPSSDVTVALVVTGDTHITVSPSSLTFTAQSWGTAQTVTVSAAIDPDLADGTATIAHTATGGGFDGSQTRSVTAREVDNTGQVVLRNAVDTETVTGVAVPENGSAAYKVKLSHQPLGGVTVRLTLQSPSAGGDADITASPTTLSFNAGNWETAKTVTLRAANDADALAGTRVITHTATGGGYNSPASALTATEADDDKSIVLSPGAVSVAEEGTATYGISLSVAPTADVTVTIAEGTGANDDANITVTSSKTLTFTPQNWGTQQTVTLSAAADDDLLNGSRAIDHSASSTDAGYDIATASLTATEADNDTGAVVIRSHADDADITALGVPEGGTARYKVKLSKRPRANVTVTLAEAATGDMDITISSPSGKRLTFTPSNWNVGRTVTLRAAQDSGALFGSRAIDHTASGADSGYAGATAVSLTASEMEDDVEISVHDGQHNDISAITVTEGGTATYEVELSAEPMGDVTLTLTTSGDADITVDTDDVTQGDQDTLTFTASNWSDGQEVTVSAAADLDKIDGAATITHRATGGGYDNTGPATLRATESDTTAGGNAIGFQQQAPGAVTGLTIGRSGGTVTASWDAADGATGYDVNYSTDGMYSWTRAATNQPGTSHTLSGADGTKPYVIAVRAVNDAGAGGWTNSAEAPAPTPPPGDVGAVTAVHGGSTVTVTWDAADGATGYDVNYSTDGMYSWTRAATNQPGTSHALSGADGAKTYVIAVRAVNDAGAGGWTNSPPAGPP